MPPRSKPKCRALTVAAALTLGRLLQCLKMSAFSRSLSAHRNPQGPEATRRDENLAHGGEDRMRTVEAEVDGGLHPLVAEERLQLLAGRRSLLPRLHQPAPSIDSSDQQQNQHQPRRKRAESSSKRTRAVQMGTEGGDVPSSSGPATWGFLRIRGDLVWGEGSLGLI